MSSRVELPVIRTDTGAVDVDPDDGPLTFTPRRAMASFDNLVALANAQERMKEARRMVWRDRGEPVAMLDSLQQCIEHAAKGGLRAGGLAACIRALFNVVLALIRLPSTPKQLRFVLVRNAIFGYDTLQFGAMLGTFVSTYKYLINALPILIPAISPADHSAYHSSPFDDEDEDTSDIEIAPSGPLRMAARRKARTLPVTGRDAYTLHIPLTKQRDRSARLSMSAEAQMVIVRKRTRRWHAALAGFVAGALGIAWEKQSRRVILGQQLFVRGLQGGYNSWSTKKGIHIPHGDILVFSLACGQIMYAWLLRPDTMPMSYNNWILTASKVPRDVIPMHRDLFRGKLPDVKHLDALINHPNITPENFTELTQFKADFFTSGVKDPSLELPLFAPCAGVHPWHNSCLSVPAERFLVVARWILPVYGAIHIVPALLFKRKMFMREPLAMLSRAGWGALRSSSFLGVFVIIYQSLFCMNHQTYLRLSALPKDSLLRKLTPQWFIDFFVRSRFGYWYPGFATGLSLLVEEKRRRGELAMYVLPKGLESAWRVGTGRVRVWTGVRRPAGARSFGTVLMTAIGTAMLMGTYQNDPEHLSGLVRRILYQFIGPN